jgi:hypothetical protein
MGLADLLSPFRIVASILIIWGSFDLNLPCSFFWVSRVLSFSFLANDICSIEGTVFAYGQTNSGKTHTMRGSPIEPGVIPLAVHDLFDTIYQDASREFLLRMSYLEIYNEDINDLLAPEHRKLQIHENLEKGIFVAGLREEIVASPQQVLEMMEFGECTFCFLLIIFFILFVLNTILVFSSPVHMHLYSISWF